MLELSGSLILDSDRLAHVHARFPGEVVELGVGDGSQPIAFGQHVHKGQVLAVIWSRDLGEKKSELIDGLSQLRVDEETLQRLSDASSKGAIPERTLREAQRRVEADRIAVSRSVRTLQSWRISKGEIDAVRAEAARLVREKMPAHDDVVQQWARVDVVAPLSGVVIERNVALGELVDTSADLFKIADLTRLHMSAHAYEEDMPTLDALPASQRVWSVTVGSDGDAATRIGRFDQVGCIIDPNQHTALVMGWVDNLDGKLRVGQFVKTRLEIPPPPGEVVVPASALCEESDRAYVFVQIDGKSMYARRTVAVIRHQGDEVHIPQPAHARGEASRAGAAGGGRAGGGVAGGRAGRLPRRSAAERRRSGRKSEVAMINHLIRWAVHNRLVVILLAAGLMGYGIHAYREVNVEAYPVAAPAIVEVVARYPGARPRRSSGR